VFTSGATAVVLAVLGSGLGLFALGAAITIFTGRGAMLSGARQLAIGWAAAAVTFGIGSAIGETIG
jgi:VIT1/CCC1 family predicted Fe2+/Mn2+ transporter